MTHQEIKQQTLKRDLKIFEIWKEAGTPTTSDLLPILRQHNICLSKKSANYALRRAIAAVGYGKPRPTERKSYELFRAS